nr:EOG090X0HLW [Triops cancriformis]
MKFRFCGDQDCPDWLLAEMATLARLTSIKFKLLAQEIAKHLQGASLDVSSSLNFSWPIGVWENYGRNKLPSNLDEYLVFLFVVCITEYSTGEKDLQATIAAVKFVLNSAARHVTDEEVLNHELQQLGLPKEHATAISRVWTEAADSIRESQKSRSLAINRVEHIGCTVENNQVALVLHTRDAPSGQQHSYSVGLPLQQTQLLLHELRQAAKLLEQFVPKDA